VSDPELARLGEAFSLVQRARILKRHGASYDRALRARDRWDDRWATAFTAVWQQHLQPKDWDALVSAGQQAWNLEVEKAGFDPRQGRDWHGRWSKGGGKRREGKKLECGKRRGKPPRFGFNGLADELGDRPTKENTARFPVAYPPEPIPAAAAMNRLGVAAPIITIGGWADETRPDFKPDPAVYAAACAEYARRFPNATISLWNEPNLNLLTGGGLAPTPGMTAAEVAALVVAAANAIRAVNPNARIIGPSIAPVGDWEPYFRAVYGAIPRGLVDVGINLYPQGEDSTKMAQLERWMRMAKKFGRVHVTEIDVAAPWFGKPRKPGMTAEAYDLLSRMGAKSIIFHDYADHADVMDELNAARRFDKRCRRRRKSKVRKGELPEELEKARWTAPAEVLLQVVNSVLQVQVGSIRDFMRGAMAVYLSLARDEGEDAGQHTLDQLGLNRTFRWTSVRDMPRDPFSVRGSKVIQHAYGSHIDELRKIIIEATDPRQPKTQSEIRAEIRDRWRSLTAKQVARIARTEVAAVWDTTSVNAQLANDVRWFDISVAKGPSIGPPNSEAVCKQCIAAAAGGPYPVQELPRVPLHPNCRCVTIPALSRDWLPPKEPWSGGPYPQDALSVGAAGLD
jgi:hypothetical protein